MRPLNELKRLQNLVIKLGLVMAGLVVGLGVVAATLITLMLHHPTLHNQLWPQLERWTEGQVTIAHSSGTVWQGLTLEEVHINTPDINLYIDKLHWQWRLSALVKGRLHFNQLQADHSQLLIKNTADNATQPTEQLNPAPFALISDLSWGLRIDQLAVQSFELQQTDGESLIFANIQAALAWRAAQLQIKHVRFDHESYHLNTSGLIKILNESEFSGRLENQLRGLMDEDIRLNLDWQGRIDSLQINTQLITPFAVNAEHQLTLLPSGLSLTTNWQNHTVELNPQWHFALSNAHSRLDWINQQLAVTASAQTKINQGAIGQHTINLTLQEMDTLQLDWLANFAQTGTIQINGDLNLTQKTSNIRLQTQALQLNQFADFDGTLDTDMQWTLLDFDHWQSELKLKHFGLVGLPQPLTATGQLHSKLTDDKLISLAFEQFKLGYGQYKGEVKGQLLGNKDLTQLSLPQAQLNIGANRINLSAEYGEQLHLNANGQLRNLAQLWPRLDGRGEFKLELQGDDISHAHVSLNLDAQQLRFDDMHVENVQLQAQAPTDKLAWTQLTLQLTELKQTNAPSALINQLQLTRKTHQDGLRTELQLQHPQLSLRAQADETSPSFSHNQIVVNWLDIESTHSGNWQLTAPWLIEWQSPNQLTSNQACLDSRQHQHAKLCLQAFDQQRLTWSMQAWPIFSWIKPYIPQAISLDGLLNGQGALIWQTDWQLQQQFDSPQLNAIVRQQGYEWPLLINNWQLDLSANAGEFNLNSFAKINQDGQLDARIKLTPNQAWSDADIDGHISLGLNDWPLSEAVLSLMTPHHSKLLLNSALSGRIDNIQHDTRANIDVLFDLPVFGLKQQQVLLQAQLNEAAIQAHGLWKQANNQQAEFAFDLTNLQQQPQLNVQLKTDYLNLLNTPFARLNSAANIKLVYQQQHLDISGEMEIKDSQLNLDTIPLRERTQLSQDEIIMDRENQPVVNESALQLSFNLKLNLADKVQIKMQDAQAYAGGELRIEKTLQNPDTLGFGQVSLTNGHLQLDARNRIEIDPSFFNFNGSLNNPALNVNLSRQVQQTQTRLNITGTATQPQFVFYSTPHLSQGQIINLLIFGRAADLDQEPNYQSQVVSAFYKLGIQNNTPLLNQLTQTLGIEDVYFDIRDQQTSNLILGRALTDKLYIRYAMGLGGQQNNAVQMFYQLAPNWFIESQSGDQSRSLDLIFRKER